MSMRSTDYALLAQESYQTPTLNKVFERDGVAYQAIDTIDDPVTGFQATAYQRQDTHEIVIAYRGTEFDREPIHDGGVDAGMVLLGVNAQQPAAAEFTQRVLKHAAEESETLSKPIEVTVTGHSLGGTLAEINAAKFGLRGETFNAYGAGSLFGVPKGGNQVIDHVRAGDLVSAASPHFGEVRIYAAQQDIDTLSKAGYRDDSGILSPRNPIKATDFDAHAIDNFVPDSKLLGQSIISPESQARYRAHEGMIDRYRDDVMDVRKVLSAKWEVPKEIVEGATALGHEVADDLATAGRAVGHAAHEVADAAKRTGREVADDVATAGRAVGHAAHEVADAAKRAGHEVVDGVTTAGRAVGHAAHEVADAAKRAGHEIANDVSEVGHAIGSKATGAWNTITHPGSWFQDKEPPARVDHPDHPGHALFQQARAGVERLDAEHQRGSDESSKRLAASLTAAARQEGMQRIDHVTLNGDASRTYAVQGDAGSPFKQIAEVNTQRAINTPVEQSTQAWQQANEQQTRAAMQAKEAQQTPQPPTLAPP
ncbi:XVIPCD domain-containing protein [Luteibacter sp. UNCMF366Tsu5.1]|uniref:XVIPCD domain-containing protein n=1 Tax=Luteibacter sp. UNCMF366Tsu5.1 TaxID=1502758 RepID=UPI000908A896|nr:XVIPCD domain-containing protein [Luteibacter sp. UNCMF366Tsu5.1]SFW62835.1 Lipase (class 3) [Luteibacter sp. UNCMF366Tsu5.1]